MLTILLVDTELELVPREMLGDYSIRIQAKKRGKPPDKMLLDSNFMHTAIDRAFPSESARRGRPDIVYHFLQVTMESILNKRRSLRVLIHTRNDFIIEIDPEIRIPKSYNRFVGVIEDLFRKETIRTGDHELMKLSHGDVNALVKMSGVQDLLILSPKGKHKPITELFPKNSAEQGIIIGGFSEGDFKSPVYSVGESYSIFDEELTIWSVAMEVIAQYERDFNFLR